MLYCPGLREKVTERKKEKDKDARKQDGQR